MEKEKQFSLIKDAFGIVQPNDCQLLKVYSTCCVIHDFYISEQDIKKAYVSSLNNCSDSEKYSFVPVSKKCNWNSLIKLCNLFSSINFEVFLIKYSPQLICRPEIIIDLLYKYRISTLNFAYLVEKFFVVRESIFNEMSRKKDIGKQIRRHISPLCKEIPGLSVDVVYELFCLVNFYELNYTEVQQVESATKAVNYCVKHGIEKDAIPELYSIRNNSAKLSLFCRRYSLDYSLMNKCIGKIVNCSIIDLLCASSYNKASTDFLLENNYVYPEFISSFNTIESPSVVIVEPSDFFVKKIFHDYLHRNVTFNIVFSSDVKCKLYKAYLREITISKSLSVNFFTFDEFLGCEKRKIDGVLLFPTRLNDAYQIKIVDVISKIVSVGTTIYSFHPSHEFEKKAKALSEFIKSEDVVIQQIDILPSGIEFATKQKKKILIKACLFTDKETSENRISLRRFWLLRDNRLFLHQDIKNVYISKQQLLESDESIRKLFAEGSVVNISGKRRGPAIEYQFSNEISAFYTISYENNTNGKVRLRVYLKDSELNSGKIVADSECRHRIYEENIEDFIENNYFFTGEISNKIIRTLRRRFWDSFGDSGVSLKTFYYLFFDWKYVISNDEYLYTCQKAIVSSRVGKINIAYATVDDYLKAYSESVINCDLDINDYLDILRAVLDVAVELEFLRKNPLIDFQINSVDEDGLSFSNRQAMRETLSKRTLSFEDTHRFLDVIFKEIDKGNFQYFGALIKLFTGLSYSHICALFWGDLVYFEKQDFYVLFPIFCIDQNGQIVKDRNVQVLRGIPCVSLLADKLSVVKSMLVDKHGEEVVKRMPIVSDYGNTGDLHDICNPKSLKELCKSVLINIGAYNSAIPVDDLSEIVKPYQGDFLSSTFRYFIRWHAHLTESEANVILGNKVSETVDKHYYDYRNPHLLHQVYLRLMKIEEELASSDKE